MKRFIATILAVLCALTQTPPAYASNSVSGGYAGINLYNYCGYGNRLGSTYCSNLSNQLQSHNGNGYNYNCSYLLSDNAVTTTSVASASSVTFFAYSGHGLDLDAHSENAKANSLHMNMPSGGFTTVHSRLGQTSYLINLATTQISFPHKYVTLYTCNRLTNDGDNVKATNILKMMNGTRLIMGFASVMYLDPREGTLYGDNLGIGHTIQYAYFDAAQRYQTQRADGDTIARTVGYQAAFNDSLSNYYSAAPAYNSSPASFGVLRTVTIPHNGILL